MSTTTEQDSSTTSVEREETVDSAYPMLVDNIDPTTLTGGGGADAMGALATTAGNTISKVLAWRGQTTDAAGFQAALAACFSLSEDEGHVVATYTPRALSVQGGSGAITGAQASLYARAVSTQDLVLAQLANLTVLDPIANLEDAEALRTLVRESLTELVSELGMVGGPRIPRVNTLFDVLTGAIDAPGRPVLDAIDVGAQLGQLRDRFGLLRVNVNDLDDEQVLTGYYTIVDAISSLQSSWVHQRKGFAYLGGPDDFLGTTTTKLSWALAAAAQQLSEVRFLLGSVFLRDAELQTVLVPGRPDHEYEAMPLSDLLSWLEDFLIVRGPRFVAESGRDGVSASFTPMAKTLTTLVTSLSAVPRPQGWPKAMSAPRVTNAFAELGTYMSRILQLASPVSRYGVRIDKVVAMHGRDSILGENTWLLTVIGSGFMPEHAVVLRQGRASVQGVILGIGSVNLVNDANESELRLLVSAEDGDWTVVILDETGTEQGNAPVTLATPAKQTSARRASNPPANDTNKK